MKRSKQRTKVKRVSKLEEYKFDSTKYIKIPSIDREYVWYDPINDELFIHGLPPAIGWIWGGIYIGEL